MSEKDFDKGYKSGFQFGKEVANEERMNRIKQARNEIDSKYDDLANSFCEREQGRNEVIEEILTILDELIAESET